MNLAKFWAIRVGEIPPERLEDNQMTLDNLPFNWFDIAVAVVLLVGIMRGRKRGMSEECLTMLNWVTLVAVCSIAYEPIGQLLASVAPFSQLFCYRVAYVATALVVASVFLLLKRALSGKLLGSDVFGRAEYYLGMPSGMLRFACILMAALALLNARLYRAEEVKAMAKFQNDNYGSQFFPTMQTVQDQVFTKSLIGPQIKTHLDFLLIKPTAPQNRQLERPTANLP
jgi:uncharacterized membrane protein required for colicin V production